MSPPAHQGAAPLPRETRYLQIRAPSVRRRLMVFLDIIQKQPHLRQLVLIEAQIQTRGQTAAVRVECATSQLYL